jgi:hypothetical protein
MFWKNWAPRRNVLGIGLLGETSWEKYPERNILGEISWENYPGKIGLPRRNVLGGLGS